MYIDLNQALSTITRGGVVCDIGQVEKPLAHKLNKLARTGVIVKWRGHWFPVAGAPFGIGPLKTCYALPETKAAVSFGEGR